MENIERLYELLEDIREGFIYEISLNDTELHCSVTEILEDDVISDLEKVLEKIKYYAKKVSDE